MLTGSWVTSVLGYAVIVLTWLNQTFVEQGIPKTGKEWIAFGMGNIGGLIGVFAKDHNVSNSGTNAVAHTVPSADSKP